MDAERAPLLRARGLEVFYGAAQALRGVDLDAADGAITCILGRNGVGKTSLVRALMGQQPVSRGTVTFAGVDVTGMPTWERVRNGFACVPQGREIFPLLSVEENLHTALAAAPAGAGVGDDIWALFPVLRSMRNRRGGDLSGGQQQQLAIARALVTRPRLLILDEPTEGIQPSIIKDIGAAIADLRGSMSILLVEQYFDFAHDLADDFCILDRGEVVMQGAAGDIDPDRMRRHLTV